MIGRLRGLLADKSLQSALIDVSGVAYEVLMSPRSLAELPAAGSEVVVHTHLHVREDSLTFYGFGGEDERDLFRILLGASGVGPKLALAILSTLTPVEVTTAVVSEDTDALTAVSGIGKRSAQKLILDLRSRLELPEAVATGGAGTALGEVRVALEGLGYGSSEIREAIKGLDGEEAVESLLRAALQRLGRQ